jgi:hypothetical protein
MGFVELAVRIVGLTELCFCSLEEGKGTCDESKRFHY